MDRISTKFDINHVRLVGYGKESLFHLSEYDLNLLGLLINISDIDIDQFDSFAIQFNTYIHTFV